MSDKTVEKYAEMLLNAKNLVLTGAPGTGKTHLAREIAKEITKDQAGTPQDKLHWAFVQFHPSYDYTDFVEGLRPTPPGKNGNIGFERKDGIFKEFCRKALAFQNLSEEIPEQQESQSADNRLVSFDTAWNKMIEYLKKNHYIDSKTLKGKPFRIGLNKTQTGLAHGKKSNRYISREQALNVYEGRPGTPRKGHNNYFKAAVKEMERSFGLKNFKADNTATQVKKASAMKNFVFIIDEINRGDIAKIFGELFFAIDPDYRGEKGRIPTQYANLIKDTDKDEFKKGFYVPENVYIIGTMNDIDRNVECMDFAIRRRFTWVEIDPTDTIAMWNDAKKGIPEYKVDAEKYMKAINTAIRNTPGLGPAYQLGAAYFLKLKNYGGDFELLWKNHIGPLLKEYLRGMHDVDATVNNMKQEWDKALKADPPKKDASSSGTQTEAGSQEGSSENQTSSEQL